MNYFTLLLGLVAATSALSVSGVQAQAPNAPAFWQGMLNAGEQDVRVIVRMEERRPGDPSCFVNIVERAPAALRCAAVTNAAGVVRFTVPQIPASFEGKIAPDGRSLEGTWTSPTYGPRPLKLASATEETAWSTDTAAHRLRFVTADDGVRLEVLDFGGEGPPLILVGGLGGAAHALDAFATRLSATHHVYTYTRRGFGMSDQPTPSDRAYSTRRLGDDLLAIMDALKLDRPVLAGFSFGGAELSSVATRHPEKVSALVYLDGALAYSFYAPQNLAPEGINPIAMVNDLKARLALVTLPQTAPGRGAEILGEMLRTDLPQLQAELVAWQGALQQSQRPPAPDSPGQRSPDIDVMDAIIGNTEKFGRVGAPVLAIFAVDTPLPPNAPESMRAEHPRMEAEKKALITRYRTGNPTAKVVEIKGASHAVFNSHPEEVLSEMTSFLQEVRTRRP